MEKLTINGKEPLFHIKMDCTHFGLTEEQAIRQNMADEYAVVENEKADAGIVIYAKNNDVWKANPWDARFLVKALIEIIKSL